MNLHNNEQKTAARVACECLVGFWGCTLDQMRESIAESPNGELARAVAKRAAIIQRAIDEVTEDLRQQLTSALQSALKAEQERDEFKKRAIECAHAALAEWERAEMATKGRASAING